MTKPKKYRIRAVLTCYQIGDRVGLSIAEFPTGNKVSKETFFMHEDIMRELSVPRRDIFALLSPGTFPQDPTLTQLADRFKRSINTALARISLDNDKHRRVHVTTPAPQ